VIHCRVLGITRSCKDEQHDARVRHLHTNGA
jgi:hypothetical protein